MLATFYDLILHGRDPKASAIQRLYSTLAIRCQADNKVHVYKGTYLYALFVKLNICLIEFNFYNV